MAEFRMPSLGADMEAGTLLKWRIEPGQTVHRGDIVAEVATEKADIDVEVYTSGVVEKLLIEPGTKVPVGTALAIIRGEGEAEAAAAPEVVAPAPAEEAAAEKAPPEKAMPPAEVPPPIPAEGARVPASPAARAAARRLGIELAGITGSGPGGAVELADVERAAAALTVTQPAAAPAARPGMRRAIAAAMARSNREIPHYYLETRIDMTRALAWLAEANRQRPVEARMLPLVLLLKAVAAGLRAVPELNAWWVEDELQRKDEIHLGVAISLRAGGLVIPALHHVDRQSPDELMAALGDLIERARQHRLRGSEVTDGTMTVTSLGDLGVETVFGVIYPPQVALVGFGRIAGQPWAENGMLGVRPVVSATLAGDHRATDGHTGARFLDAVTQALQQPERMEKEKS